MAKLESWRCSQNVIGFEISVIAQKSKPDAAQLRETWVLG
jgi:hypothetical protein